MLIFILQIPFSMIPGLPKLLAIAFFSSLISSMPLAQFARRSTSGPMTISHFQNPPSLTNPTPSTPPAPQMATQPFTCNSPSADFTTWTLHPIYHNFTNPSLWTASAPHALAAEINLLPLERSSCTIPPPSPRISQARNYVLFSAPIVRGLSAGGLL